MKRLVKKLVPTYEGYEEPAEDEDGAGGEA